MLLSLLDYIGVAVFAVSGAIAASRRRLDLVAFIFFATMTGIGGGTLRDLILDVPVFWTEAPEYLGVCALAAVGMWFLADRAEHWGRPLRWADAVGLAAYSVMGAAKALGVGSPPSVAIVMGVSTATFGGVMRDLVAGEPSVIIRPEIYLTAAFLGAGTFALLSSLGLNAWWAAGFGFSAALLLRGGAIIKGWHLPGYAGRTKKRP
ncbi:MAG: trimeric intracellular cation channel family protein [Gammaproteobacteria bacterium]